MKALALFSGGLDSLLAIKIIKDMGIDVLALHFNIGFVGKNDKSEALKEILAQIDVPLKVIDIRKQFFDEVLFAPKYGYGKYFNPCIDCHGNHVWRERGCRIYCIGDHAGRRYVMFLSSL